MYNVAIFIQYGGVPSHLRKIRVGKFKEHQENKTRKKKLCTYLPRLGRMRAVIRLEFRGMYKWGYI